MSIILKRPVIYTHFLIALLSASLLRAQQTTEPPRAPVPAPIITSKKVFISNASGESITPPGSGDMTYSQFYASLKSWGRYELMSTPVDADLVFEIRYETPFGPVNVSSGNGYSSQYPQIRLTILDSRSHTILWAFTESVRQVSKHATGLQNFGQAMDALMGDIKALAAAPVAPRAPDKQP